MQDFDAWIMALPTVQENRSKMKILDNLYHYFDRFWDIDRQYVMHYLDFNEKTPPHIREEIHHVLHENNRQMQMLEDFLEGLSEPIKDNILLHAHSQLLTCDEVLLEENQEPPFLYFLIKGTLEASISVDGPRNKIPEGSIVGIGNVFGTRSFFRYRVISKFAFIMRMSWIDLLSEIREEKRDQMVEFFAKLSSQFMQDKYLKTQFKMASEPNRSTNIILEKVRLQFRKIAQPIKLLNNFSRGLKKAALPRDHEESSEKEIGTAAKQPLLGNIFKASKGVENSPSSPVDRLARMLFAKLRDETEQEEESKAEPPNLENLTRLLIRLAEETRQRGSGSDNAQFNTGLEFARNRFKEGVLFYDPHEDGHNPFQLDKVSSTDQSVHRIQASRATPLKQSTSSIKRARSKGCSRRLGSAGGQ